MRVMEDTRTLANELMEYSIPFVSADEFSAIQSAFNAGEFTLSIWRACAFLMSKKPEGAEPLLERGLSVGLNSKYFSADFRELFSQKVA